MRFDDLHGINDYKNAAFILMNNLPSGQYAVSCFLLRERVEGSLLDGFPTCKVAFDGLMKFASDADLYRKDGECTKRNCINKNQNEKKCYKCNEMEHFARDCPRNEVMMMAIVMKRTKYLSMLM